MPSLQALINAKANIVAVVSQPDRPAGRGQEITSPPIAQLAKSAGLALLQPERIKDGATIAQLKQLAPDVMLVVAYGQIFPQSILTLPRHGCVNLHFSLLPSYRGPAPVQWALINGDEVSGVTTILLTERVDAGPILQQRKVPIHPEDTIDILEKRLANAGAELLLETLDQLRGEMVEPVPQRESLASKAPLLKKDDGLIDWLRPAPSILNQIRGMTPWPGTFTELNGKRLKILKATLTDRISSGPPGTVKSASAAGIEVGCGKGGLLLQELQIEGGKKLSAADFLNGHPIAIGTKLGT